MNLIVPLITLLTFPPFNDAISPSEQTTLINAVNVVLFKQQLSALVTKCGGMLNDIDEVDTFETDRLIREKLKIDISKFIREKGEKGVGAN